MSTMDTSMPVILYWRRRATRVTLVAAAAIALAVLFLPPFTFPSWTTVPLLALAFCGAEMIATVGAEYFTRRSFLGRPSARGLNELVPGLAYLNLVASLVEEVIRSRATSAEATLLIRHLEAIKSEVTQMDATLKRIRTEQLGESGIPYSTER